MVVATSGNGYINYNVILSSTSFPYPVQFPASKTYRDPSFDTNRSIKGLYITGSLTALSLIFDSTNFYTDLASIDFSSLSISFTRSFPKMPTN